MKQFLGFLMGVLMIIGTVSFWLFGLALLLAFPVMWCWNFVIPVITNFPSITYWQAFALYFLCSLLFKQTKTVERDKK